MKFAKELEQDLVPEWRAKYLNYKQGKKKIKAVARALRGLSQTPKTPGRKRPANLFLEGNEESEPIPAAPFTSYPVLNRRRTIDASDPENASIRNALLEGQNGGFRPETTETVDGALQTMIMHTPPLGIAETQPLRTRVVEGQNPRESFMRYGSIIPTPPRENSPPPPDAGETLTKGPPSLELPDPVLDPNDDGFSRRHKAWQPGAPPKIETTKKVARDAYAVGETRHPQTVSGRLIPNARHLFQPRRVNSTPGLGAVSRAPEDPRGTSRFRRMMTNIGVDSPRSNNDVPLEAYRELDFRQEDFFSFLDKELQKIESFYKMKEKEANERLQVLRDQLHEMRDRRMEEVVAATQHNKNKSKSNGDGRANPIVQNGVPIDESPNKGPAWLKPVESVLSNKHHFGKNTKALGQLGTPPGANGIEGPNIDDRRDFVRRPEPHSAVPYRLAKRKLKIALQEYYRGLELLKSYALLNRTAFRKINKKYDKAVNARPTGRYISEKVNKAWFVQSEVVEGHIVAVEDLYARYFERGNHKIAVGKLRSKGLSTGDYSPNTFRDGSFLAAGLVLALQGCVYASQHLHDPDPSVRSKTSYLMQLYGGYFLATFHFLLFCLDCRVWARAKINYVFIFEYDTRHVLDWRQLAELPCFFFFLLGLFFWLNFGIYPATDPMFQYLPVLLIGVTILILFFPAKILYYRAREWWAYSNWRLLLAGLYPVEFRDFFLGDMYCSQTYAMGNIEVFFCLYANDWNNPARCNSSHSRLLGFLSTLPGIWRALQCLRRYYDTRNIFPHLVNCGKYIATIAFYMSLSLYRINRSVQFRALFIAFATVNSIYTSVWDLAMDWSLGNPYAKNPFLRDVLGYKHAWYYYVAMIIDPILRFNWIFYAIYAEDLQHSAILSFLVSLSEIMRRGMWSLFRVENEHCTNVGRFRASRDIPLPYDIPSALESKSSLETSPRTSKESIHRTDHAVAGPTSQTPEYSRATGTDIEAHPRPSPGSGEPATTPKTPKFGSPLRLRRTRTHQGQSPQTPVQRGIVRVGSLMAAAHSQDFERKRRPNVVGEDVTSPHMSARGIRANDSSDEDDDDGDEDDGLDLTQELSRDQGAVEWSREAVSRLDEEEEVSPNEDDLSEVRNLNAQVGTPGEGASSGGAMKAP